MNAYFENTRDVATSARSEILFHQTKKYILTNKIPEKLDVFLSQHCRELDKKMKIIRAQINKTAAN